MFQGLLSSYWSHFQQEKKKKHHTNNEPVDIQRRYYLTDRVSSKKRRRCTLQTTEYFKVANSYWPHFQQEKSRRTLQTTNNWTFQGGTF